MLLSKGICDYTLLPKILGRGKFSTVFMASRTGELSAIKHTALFPHHHLIATRLLREPTLLAELPPHPNLVTVKETIRTPGHFYLVEEYLEGYVTLEALLPMLDDHQPPILPVWAAEKILTQLLSAVHAIHVPLQICHRDIKPENILVHPTTMQLKLLDFGLATHFSKSEPKLTTCCGSPAFHCPEIVKALASPPGQVTYMGPEVDAWTCGVTMLRCLTGARFPLGASHSSLRAMAIRAQRAVAAIQDPSMRERVAALLDMDGPRRMRKFNELIQEQERVLGEPERGNKNFKSTTFIPVEPTHTMKLPLLASHLTDQSMAAPTPGLGPSRRSTPANSRPPSRPPSPGTSSPPRNATTADFPIAHTLVALNPMLQPPERVLSFIKYCLRCAGILYHSWPDTPTLASSSPSASSGSSSSASAGIQVSQQHHAAFAEAISRTMGEGPTPPVTPLYPPTSGSGMGPDRQDGWAHVQIFQCVIELVDEPPKTQEKPLSLVQSIMAAFGRRMESPKQQPQQQSQSQHPSYKRSSSMPAKPRPDGQAQAPGTPAGTSSSSPSASASQDGMSRFLTFYLVVRFPKAAVVHANRPPHSRTSSSVGRRSRASSAANTPMLNGGGFFDDERQYVTDDEGRKGDKVRRAHAADAMSATIKDAPTTQLSSTAASSRSSRSRHNTNESLHPSNGSGLAIDTSPERLLVQASGHQHLTSFPTLHPVTSAARSPSTSRPASRTRKKSHRNSGSARRGGRVIFELSDERAVERIRSALAVGGQVDSTEHEDYFSFGHHSLARHSLGLTTYDPEAGGTSPVAEEVDTPRQSRSTSVTTVDLTNSTPKSAHHLSLAVDNNGNEEDAQRGRQRHMAAARLARMSPTRRHTTFSPTNMRHPSQLSVVAVKEEESPTPNIIDAAVDALNAALDSQDSEDKVSKKIEALMRDILKHLHDLQTQGPSSLSDFVSPRSFSLFGSLSPVLGLPPRGEGGDGKGVVEAHNLALSALELIAQSASPRELFLASQERLEVVSTKGNEDKERQPQLFNRVYEVAGLLHVLSIVVPRIKTNRHTNFTAPLSSTVAKSVKSTLSSSSAAKDDEHKAAVSYIVRMLCDFVVAVKHWEAGEGKGTKEASSDVVYLFFASLVPLISQVYQSEGCPSLSELEFRRAQPKYDFERPGQNGTGHEAIPQSAAWQLISNTVDTLKLDLYKHAFARDGTLNAEATARIANINVGAFVLLVTLAVQKRRMEEASIFDSEGAKSAIARLRQSLALIIACLGAGPPATTSSTGMDGNALSGSGQLADAALTWVMWCVEGIGEGVMLDEELAIVLTQTLSSHAALCPSPTARLAAMRVLTDVLIAHTSDSLSVELLRDLIVDSPFPQLRTASLGLARELIDTKVKQGVIEPLQGFLSDIAPIITVLPESLPPPLASKEGKAEREDDQKEALQAAKAFLDDHGAWLTECCGLVYFCAVKDQQIPKNSESSEGKEREPLLGVGSKLLKQTQLGLVGPMQKWLHAWTDSETGRTPSEIDSQMSVLHVTLDRIASLAA